MSIKMQVKMFKFYQKKYIAILEKYIAVIHIHERKKAFETLVIDLLLLLLLYFGLYYIQIILLLM